MSFKVDKSCKKELFIILFSYPISSIIDNILFIIGNIIIGLTPNETPFSFFGDTYGLLLIWISINLYATLNILFVKNKS